MESLSLKAAKDIADDLRSPDGSFSIVMIIKALRETYSNAYVQGHNTAMRDKGEADSAELQHAKEMAEEYQLQTIRLAARIDELRLMVKTLIEKNDR